MKIKQYKNCGEKSFCNRLLQGQNMEKLKCKANIYKLAARNYIVSKSPYQTSLQHRKSLLTIKLNKTKETIDAFQMNAFKRKTNGFR